MKIDCENNHKSICIVTDIWFKFKIWHQYCPLIHKAIVQNERINKIIIIETSKPIRKSLGNEWQTYRKLSCSQTLSIVLTLKPINFVETFAIRFPQDLNNS